MHRFECGSKIGSVECLTLGGNVGDNSIVITLGSCTEGSTLGGGAGGLVIFGENMFRSDSVVKLEEMVKLASEAKLYLPEKCEQSD